MLRIGYNPSRMNQHLHVITDTRAYFEWEEQRHDGRKTATSHRTWCGTIRRYHSAAACPKRTCMLSTIHPHHKTGQPSQWPN